MTKVQLNFELERPLDEALMEAIANVHGNYGIQLVRLLPSMDSILVEYDASRLTETDVEAMLHRTGVPVRRKFTLPKA
jgi:allophanate hydrolase subunit 1